MKAAPTQVSFSSGELSPKLHGRVDLDQYFSGAGLLKNLIPLPHGPFCRRNGSRFINACKTTGKTRLVGFKFSILQSLVLEFGAGYIRFYFEGGLVLTSGGTAPYEVVTTYTESELADINWAQSADVLYITHPAHKPAKLSRLANNNWTLADVTFTNAPTNWTTGNYPSVVYFFEQRLYYAATPNKPQTIWASRIGLFDEFTMKDSGGEVLADHAFEYTVSSDDVNGIKWLKAVDVLAAGTSGSEYKISSSSLNEALTPSNVRITRQTPYGSAPVRPVQVGSTILFAQRSRTRIRAFEFVFTENQYSATDVTMMAEHILNGQVKEMDVQTAPDTFVWCVTDDGKLVGLTYEKQQKVLAWHQHDLSGIVESIAVIPHGDADQVWMVVRRTINGATVKYVEMIDDASFIPSAPEDSFYVDSGLTYTGAPTAVISGASHLIGQEVDVLVDGWVHPRVTVSAGGTVTLQSAGSKIHLGLPIVARFEGLPVVSQDTVTAGAIKRIIDVTVSLFNSLGFSIGVKNGRLDKAYMGPTDVMGKAAPLFTGNLRMGLSSSPESEQAVVIEQPFPLPLCVRSLTYSADFQRLTA